MTKSEFYKAIVNMTPNQSAELKRLIDATDRAWLQYGINAQLQAQQELKAFTDTLVLTNICENTKSLNKLGDAYRSWCSSQDLPTDLSADDLMHELPESAKKAEQWAWLEQFIVQWDAAASHFLKTT